MASKKAINNTIIGSVVAVIIIGYVLMNSSPVGNVLGEDVEFDVSSFQWGFEPQFIKVNKDDHVILKLTSDDVAHGIAIDEYQINEPILPNQVSEVEFIADEPGVYHYYCSVPCGVGHDEQGGYLIVNDPSEPKPEISTVTSAQTDVGITIDGIVDEEWNKAAESIFTTLFVDDDREIFVKSLNDGEKIYFLLRWQDDDANNDGTTETDRIALGFDISGNADIAMGAAGVPHVTAPQRTIGEGVVDIWHWKAFDSHTESTNLIDDEFAGPFEQLKEHYYRDDDHKYGGNNDLSAVGIFDDESQEWIVEISRVLVSGDTAVEGFGMIDKQFTPGNEYKIGFAVWDGGRGETAGKHAVTDWGILRLE